MSPGRSFPQLDSPSIDFPRRLEPLRNRRKSQFGGFDEFSRDSATSHQGTVSRRSDDDGGARRSRGSRRDEKSPPPKQHATCRRENIVERLENVRRLRGSLGAESYVVDRSFSRRFARAYDARARDGSIEGRFRLAMHRQRCDVLERLR